MNNWQSRTERLLGKDAVEKLGQCRVAVFGIGGVGGFTVEALARGGVGALDLIDHDQVSVSNINRQIIATTKTVGRDKVDVAEERILEINPSCKVTKHKVFFLPETEGQFDFSQYDYVVDAIDTVKGKIGLITAAKAAGTPVICAMGAGNKLDPTQFEVADIHKTSVDPLARIIRQECRKRGIRNLKVVYSKEPPVAPQQEEMKASDISAGSAATPAADCLINAGIATAADCPKAAGTAGSGSAGLISTGSSRPTPGSLSFVPSVAGLIIAGEVIKDLIRSVSPDHTI